MVLNDRSAARLIVAVAVLVGLAIRWSALDYEVFDAEAFLRPWYEHARRHGLASLGHEFTNYTPAFSYLLLGATLFDGLAPALTLIKGISFVFELATAILATCLVRVIEPRPLRPVLAFAAVWLLPSVLHNGAFWGQADAIWTALLLASLLALCHARPLLAIVLFGVAVSVKASAVFFGPVLFALALRGTIRWAWFVAIPIAYAALSVPPFLLGRSLWSLATVYFGQAQAFSLLSVSAANLYVFFPETLYGTGLPAAILIAALAGLGLALALARPDRLTHEQLIVGAALALVLMPFVLPKMHERYFYAFEVLAVVLACARPSLWPIAVMAQITSMLAYLPFDGRGDIGVPIAAVTNGAILVVLSLHLRALLRGVDAPNPDIFVAAVVSLWIAFVAQAGLLLGWSRFVDPTAVWPSNRTDMGALVLFIALFALTVFARDALAERADASRPRSLEPPLSG